MTAAERHDPVAPAVCVVRSIAACNDELAATAPSDAILLAPEVRLAAGAAERLAAAASSDPTCGLAGPLAVEGSGEDVAERLAAHARRVRPRLLGSAAGCLYVRRRALELVGCLDERFETPEGALVDLAQRCIARGLQVALADDALVTGAARAASPSDRALLDEWYPWLVESPVDDPAPPSLGSAFALLRRAEQGLVVALDVRVVEGAISGSQLHVLELARALAENGAAHVRLVVSDRLGDEARLRLESLPRTELLTAAGAARGSVVHRPSQVAVPHDLELLTRLGDRVIVTQQDLIAYRTPSYHASSPWWRQYRRMTRLAMAMADSVIFSSRHTLDDALADDLVDERRAHVLPIAAENGSAVPARRPERLGSLPAAGYLLCIGNDFRHKNHVFALRLLDGLRRRGWAGALVLAGSEVEHGSSRSDEDAVLAERPRLAEAIVRLGPVSEAEKAWLYANAAAVAYPTLYEGFGLVPFEAGRAGAPCLFAPQASLAEVLPAEAAVLVPWDEEASAKRALPLLSASPERDAHVALLRQAAERLPTWDDHAAALIDVYEKTLALPAREARVVAAEAVDREVELAEWRALEEEFGADGYSLVRPGGYLPPDIQRALLAVATRPRLRAPLFAALRALYRAGRRGRA